MDTDGGVGEEAGGSLGPRQVAGGDEQSLSFTLTMASC